MEAKRPSEAHWLHILYHYNGGHGINQNDCNAIFKHVAALDAEIKATEQEREAIGVRLAQIKDLEAEVKELREDLRIAKVRIEKELIPYPVVVPNPPDGVTR